MKALVGYSISSGLSCFICNMGMNERTVNGPQVSKFSYSIHIALLLFYNSFVKHNAIYILLMIELNLIFLAL